MENIIVVVDDAMIACGHAGQDRCPARAAERRCHHRVGEIGTLFCHSVDVGSLEQAGLQEPHAIEAKIIDKNKDDVARMLARNLRSHRFDGLAVLCQRNLRGYSQRDHASCGAQKCLTHNVTGS